MTGYCYINHDTQYFVTYIFLTESIAISIACESVIVKSNGRTERTIFLLRV